MSELVKEKYSYIALNKVFVQKLVYKVEDHQNIFNKN